MRGRISWKKAVLHGLLALVLCVLPLGIIATLGDVPDPERAGRGAGQFGMVCFLIAMGASYQHQTGRKGSAWALVGLLVAAVTAVVVFAAMTMPSAYDLDGFDRAPLIESTEDNRRVLRHMTLGFGFPHPGPDFALLPEEEAAPLERSLAELQIIPFQFRNESSGSVFLLLMIKGIGNRQDLEGLVNGLTSVLTGSASGVVTRRDVTWSEGVGRAVILARTETGIHIELRFYSFESPARPGVPYVAMAGALTIHRNALTRVVSEFLPPRK